MAQKEKPCKYNEGIGCAAGRCCRCGWNPEIERQRKETIRKELKKRWSYRSC